MTDSSEIAADMRTLAKLTQQQKAARETRLNRRYVFSVEFTADTADVGPAGNPSVAKTSVVTIDRPFYCASLEACIRITGSTSDDGAALDIFDVPLTLINEEVTTSFLGVFDFFWSIRDSFGDREWTKGKQPSAVLETTVFGPLFLPRRQYLPAGTEVTVEIEPLYALVESIEGEGIEVDIRALEVEISLVGYEVLP